MTNTIVTIICSLLQIVIMTISCTWFYRMGVKDGVRRAVIKVLKDEEIVTELPSDKNI